MKRLTATLIALLSTLALLPATGQAQPAAGRDYSVLSPAQVTETPGKVEVVEFFWYGCPHCYSLEPALEAWVRKLPADAKFRRIPAVLSDAWVPHAQAFYAFEALGVLDRVHKPFFDAIHRDRLNISREDAMKQWLEKNGVDFKKFTEAARSFGVQAKVKRAAQLSSAYKLDGVPMLAVQGKYTVSAEQGGSRERMLAVTEALIDVSRKDLKK
ncbi:MAG: thiol:disulfide interchange protein DsbA/DsbL [Betaproteobacteria bacterium]|nr:thiol:disulfide interchange protein DsbA/DsbL [Betaproteobacteria bacterium]